MAKAARAMAMATKRALEMVARVMATQWRQRIASATAPKRARTKAARGGKMVTKRGRVRVARGMATATKRARSSAARRMAMETRVAGDEDGDGKGG
jgi:hypothetical protein